MVIRGMLSIVVVAIASLPLVGIAARPAGSVSKDDPVARTLKDLEGTWEVVAHEINGKNASDAGYYSPRKLVISAGKPDLFERGKADLPLKIDPTRTPKAIDVDFPGSMMLNAHERGIYALEKDELKICLPLSPVSERPTKFGSEDFRSLYVLRRMK
jgi:uncharacterized protein (TIGR03067 family)